ncbi:helix-turn-helix domain-containing protein [Carnobacterium gallinarum]|uniref:helix-turn-helix domain-containing protein n=1 Tax=Carnobacterium gallinarum TaxID=2749 RepID=UPI00054E56F8|nr:helix-turn-helix domain-containing protein [Carnobacterium gallinarum]
MNFERIFLEKLAYKEYQLYELLINSNIDQIYTTSDLAKKLGYSMNVMAKVIQNLNSRLTNLGYDPLIAVHRKSGLTVGEITLSLDELRASLMKESMIFSFVEYVAFNPDSDVMGFYDSHYISQSTLYRRVKPLLDYLETYQVGISLSQGEFVGDERNIRLFLFCMYWVGIKGVEWPFSMVDHSFVQKQAVKIEISTEYKMNLVTKHETEYFFAISMQRVAIGETVKHYEQFDKICQNNLQFNPYLYQELFPNLSEAHFMDEARFHFFIINFKPLYFEESLYLMKTLNYYQTENNIIWQVSNKLINSLKQKFPQDAHELSSPILLGNLLSINLAHYSFRSKFINLFILTDPSEEPIVKDQLTEFLEICLDEFKGSKYDVFYEMKSELVSFYYHLFSVVLKDAVDDRKSVKVGLMLDLNKLLYDRLLSFLEHSPFQIKVFNLLDYQTSVDVIISSVYLKVDKQLQPRPKIYYWNSQKESVNYINILKIISGEK